MPFLIIGILIGMPLGIASYFKMLVEADKEGNRRATLENLKRERYLW